MSNNSKGAKMFKKIFVSIMLCSIIQTALAQDFKNVKFIRNHDGDTFVFDLGMSLPDLFRTMPLRLYGIDTPEVGTKNSCEKAKGLLVRDFARNELQSAKQINLINCSKDKYFRILCSVDYDGKDLTTELLKRNYGYEYYGDKKKVINYSKK